MIQFWNTQGCNHYWKGPRPRTIPQFCQAFSTILSSHVQSSLHTMPSSLKTALRTWIQKRVRERANRMFMYREEMMNISKKYVFAMYPSILNVQRGSIGTQIEQIHSKGIPSSLSLLTMMMGCSPYASYNGSQFFPLDSSKLRQRSYLFNRNLHDGFSPFFEKTIQQQQHYVYQQLDPFQRMVMLSYTYGGDKIVNSYLLKKIDPLKVIPEVTLGDIPSAYDNYRNKYLMPLLLYLYKDWVKAESMNDLTHRLLGSFSTKKQICSSLRELWKLRSTIEISFESSYKPLLHWLCTNRTLFKEDAKETFERYVSKYVHDLRTIIQEAPRLEEPLFVYRGISTKDYIRLGEKKKHVFVQEPFMSTSLSICKAIFFKSKTSSCCLHQIFIPKGTRVLFSFLLSYFGEQEILLPPETWLYPLRPEYMFSLQKNQSLQVQDWSVVSS